LGADVVQVLPEQVFGGPVEVKPDGSVYQMVKYERAGYYVAYSLDAGDAPFVTVVMQKLPTEGRMKSTDESRRATVAGR